MIVNVAALVAYWGRHASTTGYADMHLSRKPSAYSGLIPAAPNRQRTDTRTGALSYARAALSRIGPSFDPANKVPTIQYNKALLNCREVQCEVRGRLNDGPAMQSAHTVLLLRDGSKHSRNHSNSHSFQLYRYQLDARNSIVVMVTREVERAAMGWLQTSWSSWLFGRPTRRGLW
jgi:hypothetical protein